MPRYTIALLIAIGSLTTASADRPNILFVLTEDQGAHMSFLGTPGLQTPNMDRLAKSGTYFHNAFVAYPVCSASKAALYTGLHSHTNGILNNTHNYHKPADKVTAEEHGRQLAKTNRVRDQYLTLTEILKDAGYYQGVTHKLHVLPNVKFPYDEFLGGSRAELAGFIDRAKERPWFLMVNIPYSHRPYPNSDKTPIRVDPAAVELPAYLPDAPPVRKDWAEYLAGVEKADQVTGDALDVLAESGESDNTIVIFMSDHGPTFQHGKMTLYDLGLRVPLIVRVPGMKSGSSKTLVSEIDLLPTLMELCGLTRNFDYPMHGQSIATTLRHEGSAKEREYVFAEISNRGPLPNDGMQERSVFDGRWKMIYRERVETAWRQVNADSRQFKVWGNRTYATTIRLKKEFPRQYQILAEMDPQNLRAAVPRIELYDVVRDPDEMNNLADDLQYTAIRQELAGALKRWVIQTSDPAVSVEKIEAVTNPPTLAR
ncbi:MAG: sulfatase [Pirellulaceae bacterium]